MKIFIDTKQDSHAEMQYVVALLRHVLDANGHTSALSLPPVNAPAPQSQPVQETFTNPLSMFDMPANAPSYQSYSAPPAQTSTSSAQTSSDAGLGIFDVFKDTPSQSVPLQQTPRETAEDLLRYDEEQERDDEKPRDRSDFRLTTY